MYMLKEEEKGNKYVKDWSVALIGEGSHKGLIQDITHCQNQ